MRNSG